MTDKEYLDWLEDRKIKIAAALETRRSIVASGGMATKTAVENIIMPKFNIDRSEAHDIMNEIESQNLS